MKFDKNKLYSCFNCDEVKIGSRGFFANTKKELLEKLENESDVSILTGIETSGFSDDLFCFIDDNENIYNYFYLLEEVKEYRPYASTNEMIRDYWGGMNENIPLPNNRLPTIWVKQKGTNNCHLIMDFMENRFIRLNNASYELKALFNSFTYLDDSPCGIKI